MDNANNYLFAESVSDKRVVMPSSSLVNKRMDGEGYSSIFFYTDEMTKHIESTGSVSGFNGKTFGHWFILDLDSPEGDFMKVGNAISPLLDDLEELEIQYILFHSGKKGYHIYIDKKGISYPREYENNWNILSKQFARQIADKYDLDTFVDLSVYDKVRLFRFPFSRHQKSGYYKKPVQYVYDGETYAKKFPYQEDSFKNNKEIQRLVFEGIIEDHIYAETLLTISNVKKEYKVAEKPPMEVVGDSIVIGRPYDFPICIWRMLYGTDFPKHRHAVALRLQSYFGKQGYSKKYVEEMIKIWNAGLVKQLPPAEIKALLKYYEKDYTYTCADSMKQKYCSKACKYYRTKDMENTYIYTPDTFVERYKKSLQEATDDWIRFGDIFKDLNTSPIKPLHGHMVVLVGGSSVGKTTFMNNIMYKTNHIDWLFFSYDMAGLSFTSILLGMTGLDIHSEKQALEFKQRINHITMMDDSSVAVESMVEVYDNIVRVIKRKPKAIVIDYLQIVPAKGHGATERAVAITKTLKIFAKKKKVAIFILSQVPKDLAGDGNLPIGMNAAKDSGEIVNLADQVLTFWRPKKGKSTAKFSNIDDTLRVRVAKDKYAAGDWECDLEWGQNYTIGNKK